MQHHHYIKCINMFVENTVELSQRKHGKTISEKTVVEQLQRKPRRTFSVEKRQ